MTKKPHVLVVDDHANARQSVVEIMDALGYQTSSRGSAVEALGFLADNTVDLIFSDLMMPGMDGLEFIQALSRRRIRSQVVMFTAHASVDTAVRAMKLGAYDYIQKPFTLEQLEDVASRALRQAAVTAADDNDHHDQGWQMIGDSPAMQRLKQRISQVAGTNETVLISGESGTGKELVARAIHQLSQRSDQPWVAVNCPALSPQLMESEWFGHEKGAFTTADQQRTGRFEAANHGTILLDEVTEIELPLQAKLLRVLQERCYERVGSSETRPLDVRVVATTNRDLESEVSAGTFRQDLFYRLNVIPIELPPLRERISDIPMLAEHFLTKTAQRLQTEPLPLDEHCLEMLKRHRWPGNVRELENLMTRISVLGQEGQCPIEILETWMEEGGSAASAEPHASAVDEASNSTAGVDGQPLAFSARLQTGVSLQEMERQLIEATLEQFDGHREKTAQALGIGVRTLTNKLRSYGYAPREKSYQRAA